MAEPISLRLPSACTPGNLANEKRGARLEFEKIGRTSGASQLARQNIATIRLSRESHHTDGVHWRFPSFVVHPTIRFRKGGSGMTGKQDRLHELCRQLTVEDDPQQLIKQVIEINNILGSILSDVDRAMRSVDARSEYLMSDSAVITMN
jgi:hypothetical protein